MDYPVSELLDWGENTLKPKANLAFNGEGTYIPGSGVPSAKQRSSAERVQMRS